MRQRNSKYNAKKTLTDGIQFDSALEGKYYLHLKRLHEMGEVDRIELQPSFILQGGFTDDYGVKHMPIKYVADFLVYYREGPPVVIDVKGLMTSDFKIKRKLYCAKFPLELKLVNYSKIDGGWIECDALKKARAARKKVKETKRNKEITEFYNETQNLEKTSGEFGITVDQVIKLTRGTK